MDDAEAATMAAVMAQTVDDISQSEQDAVAAFDSKLRAALLVSLVWVVLYGCSWAVLNWYRRRRRLPSTSTSSRYRAKASPSAAATAKRRGSGVVLGMAVAALAAAGSEAGRVSAGSSSSSGSGSGSEVEEDAGVTLPAQPDEDFMADEAVATWSIPFHICCFCLSSSLATVVAVPLTTIAYTQMDLRADSEADTQRFVATLWTIVVRSSNVCLFLLLPFAYFYKESSMGNELADTDISMGVRRSTKAQLAGRSSARCRAFIKRLLTSIVEVTLLGVIISGIFYLLQVVLLDGGEPVWAYPSSVVSACQTLPGLLVFVLFTPIGMQELIVRGNAVKVKLTQPPSQLDQKIDAYQFEILTLQRRIAALAPAEPHASSDTATGLTSLGSFSSNASAGAGAGAGGGVSGAGDGKPVRRRRHLSIDSTDTDASGASSTGYSITTAVDAGDNEALLAALRKRLNNMMKAKARTEAQLYRRAMWLHWVLWPFRSVLGWSMLAVPSLFAVLVVVKAALRPFFAIASSSGFLFDLRPLYHAIFGISISTASVVGCMVDIAFLLFFVVASVVGAYFSKNSLYGVSLKFMRPVAHRTSLDTMIANVAVMQLISFSLPAGAWMVGLGAFDVMQAVSNYYGHVALMRSTWFVTAYVALFIVAVVWLVLVRARRLIAQATPMLNALSPTKQCQRPVSGGLPPLHSSGSQRALFGFPGSPRKRSSVGAEGRTAPLTPRPASTAPGAVPGPVVGSSRAVAS